MRGAGAKRVRRREQHRPPAARQTSAELRHGRRLAHPVHAEHEDHGRRRGRSRERTGIARRGIRGERRRHRALERRPEVAAGSPRQVREDGLGRLDTEVGFEQEPLGRGPLALRPPAERLRQPLPQAHQGNPWRRRHAHSAVNAAIATANSHQPSRSATLASRPPAAPA